MHIHPYYGLDFKKDLELQCSEVYSSMEGTVYGVYEETNKRVEGKLQELLEVLERISMSACQS